MNSVHSRIKNFEMVTSFFGKWPSFDDFEVVSMLLERIPDEATPPNPALTIPVLTIKFFAFRWDVVAESKKRKDCLLTLRFGGLENVKLVGLNHQNAINGFLVSAKWSEYLNREVFSVELIQGFGVGATFDCGEIEVVSLDPSSPHRL